MLMDSPLCDLSNQFILSKTDLGQATTARTPPFLEDLTQVLPRAVHLGSIQPIELIPLRPSCQNLPLFKNATNLQLQVK